MFELHPTSQNLMGLVKKNNLIKLCLMSWPVLPTRRSKSTEKFGRADYLYTQTFLKKNSAVKRNQKGDSIC
jgi:hypothetical protein